jgi:hypothetical protein
MLEPVRPCTKDGDVAAAELAEEVVEDTAEEVFDAVADRALFEGILGVGLHIRGTVQLTVTTMVCVSTGVTTISDGDGHGYD